MRLREPLYGIRIAQMHFVIHFSLFLAMIFVMLKFDSDDFTTDIHLPKGRVA